MYSALQSYARELTDGFKSISIQRKETLSKIADYISSKQNENKTINLVYICTHNSRRSHFGQVWAKVASTYYGINKVETFSGGTEVTALNTNAINALVKIGFKIAALSGDKNAVHQVQFDDQQSPMLCYSKVLTDKKNPEKEFVAIMMCSEAEQNCPFIPGAELRVATPYDDPKAVDGTYLQDLKYDECCRNIGIEVFYVFSLLK